MSDEKPISEFPEEASLLGDDFHFLTTPLGYSYKLKNSNLPPPAGGSEIPIGAIMMFVSGLLPSPEWLECNGDEILRSTPLGLLLVANGMPFGDGNGIDTVNLPNFRARMPIGAGANPPFTTRAVGITGGNEGHIQTVAEMAEHRHTINIFGVDTFENGEGATRPGMVSSSPGPINTSWQGNSTSMDIMNPFLAIVFMIYAGV